MMVAVNYSIGYQSRNQSNLTGLIRIDSDTTDYRLHPHGLLPASSEYSFWLQIDVLLERTAARLLSFSADIVIPPCAGKCCTVVMEKMLLGLLSFLNSDMQAQVCVEICAMPIIRTV